MWIRVDGRWGCSGERPSVVELHSRPPPVTLANFLRYVDAGHFDGGQFHHTVHPENQAERQRAADVSTET